MGIVDFNTALWNKKWIRELTPDAKNLFIYSWTNDHKNIIAMYEIDPSKIAFELNIKETKVIESFDFLQPKVKYDIQNHIIWIVNHFRHQFMRTDKISPKIIEAARKCLISLKGHYFVAEFLKEYKSLDLFNSFIPYPYPLIGYPYPPGEVKGEVKEVLVEEKGIVKGKRNINYKKPVTLIPQNFSISESVREWANEKGYRNLQERLEYFKDWATAGNKQYADWDATFRNSIRGDWAKINNNHNKSKDPHAGLREWAAEKEAELNEEGRL